VFLIHFLILPYFKERMDSIKVLRKQVIEARKASVAPVKALKRDDLVRELEKYKKPSAPEPVSAPAPKAKKEVAPPSIKIPEIPKESALDRATARKVKRTVEEAPPPVPKAKAKKEAPLVKPEEVAKVIASVPASGKGSEEMKAKMAKLREARLKKKSAE